MVNVSNIKIEVAFATFSRQKIVSLEVPRGSTIEFSIQLSGILKLFPEIDLNKQKVGVFGKIKSLSDFVQPGDRIEIYRPLLIDPKEARKNRGAC